MRLLLLLLLLLLLMASIARSLHNTQQLTMRHARKREKLTQPR